MEQFSDPFSFYQLIGWLALLCYITAYQMEKPRDMIRCYVPADILSSVQLYGLNSYTAMTISIAALVRNVAGGWGGNRTMKAAVTIFLIFIWSLTVYMEAGIYEVGAAIGSTLRSLSVWHRDKFFLCRLLTMGFQILWLALYISIGSYSGVTMMLLTLTSNFVGTFRHGSVTKLKC